MKTAFIKCDRCRRVVVSPHVASLPVLKNRLEIVAEKPRSFELCTECLRDLAYFIPKPGVLDENAYEYEENL